MVSRWFYRGFSQSSEDFPSIGVEESLEFDLHRLLPHLTRDVFVEESDSLSDFSKFFEVGISKHRGGREGSLECL